MRSRSRKIKRNKRTRVNDHMYSIYNIMYKYKYNSIDYR